MFAGEIELRAHVGEDLDKKYFSPLGKHSPNSNNAYIFAPDGEARPTMKPSLFRVEDRSHLNVNHHYSRLSTPKIQGSEKESWQKAKGRFECNNMGVAIDNDRINRSSQTPCENLGLRYDKGLQRQADVCSDEHSLSSDSPILSYRRCHGPAFDRKGNGWKDRVYWRERNHGSPVT